MKVLLRPRWFSFAFLATLVAVLSLPIPAFAGFEKLQGDYTGGFDGFGTFLNGGTSTKQEYYGAISGGVKAKSLGKVGTFLFVVVGVSPSNTNSLVKFDFKAHGRLKTSALVPGMITLPATGKWKSKAGGKTVHFTLTATTTEGTYTAVGILKGNTSSLGLKITATSAISSANVLNGAEFIFIGDRDKGT